MGAADIVQLAVAALSAVAALLAIVLGMSGLRRQRWQAEVDRHDASYAQRIALAGDLVQLLREQARLFEDFTANDQDPRLAIRSEVINDDLSIALQAAKDAGITVDKTEELLRSGGFLKAVSPLGRDARLQLLTEIDRLRRERELGRPSLPVPTWPERLLRVLD